MDKKYQIFISSTYSDLINERKKVQDTFLAMYQFPVGMELFSAADKKQWDIIKKTIDTSDYYVLILGNRYGTVIEDGEDAGISYTEKEYRYALSKGIPVHAFLISADANVKASDVEADPEKKEKLERFKQDVADGRLVEWWRDASELSLKVMNSLYKELYHSERPGWVRGDAIDAEKTLREMTELNERLRYLEEENKKLILENQEYKHTLSFRYPKLMVQIQGDHSGDYRGLYAELYKNVDSLRENEEGNIEICMKPVHTNEIAAEFLPVSEADFFGELRIHVTNQEIDEYNASLPKEDVVQAYLDDFVRYKRIKECGIPVYICIFNEGTAKATDISLTLEFPEEILVFDIDDVDDIKEPKKPKKPKSLIDTAYMRAHASEIALEKMYSSLGLASNASRLSIPVLPNTMYTNLKYIFVSDNRVDVELKNGIVHTKDDFFQGVYIVPLKEGSYSVKVTIMCAEYREPDIKYIGVICKQTSDGSDIVTLD